MIFSFLYSLPAAALLSLGPAPEPEAVITDTLSESVLVTSYKQVLPMERIASPVSEIGMAELDSRGISDIKKLSSVVPNLHIPDYGSSMTSSIYLRGFGSRIDNPVVGMYVDDIPVMNKNAYDMELADISSAVLLRGPQSTLYGRNSMCGVLSLETFSPENFHGNRLAVEFQHNGVLVVIGDYAFKACGLREVCIPASVKRLCRGCFDRCASLKRVTFMPGSNLELIGDYAFAESAIESIEIPSSVIELGDNCFCECRSLRYVRFMPGGNWWRIVLSALVAIGYDPIEVADDVSRYLASWIVDEDDNDDYVFNIKKV